MHLLNSHTTPADSWATKTVQEWTDEIGGIQKAIAKFANIPIGSSLRVSCLFSNTSQASAHDHEIKNLSLHLLVSFIQLFQFYRAHELLSCNPVVTIHSGL